MLFGVYSIAAKRASRKLRPLTILVYTFFFGMLGLLPVYVFATPMAPLTGLNALSWASLLFLALCCSVIGFLVYNHGMGRLRASDAALTIYVTPLAGVTLAVLLLGEAMTAFTVAGAALIMAGLYATQARARPVEESRRGACDRHGGVPLAREARDGPETQDG